MLLPDALVKRLHANDLDGVLELLAINNDGGGIDEIGYATCSPLQGGLVDAILDRNGADAVEG